MRSFVSHSILDKHRYRSHGEGGVGVSRAEERVPAGGVTQKDTPGQGWVQVSQQIGGRKALLLSDGARIRAESFMLC